MKKSTTERTFTLGQVLSVTTGKLLCEVDGLYDILSFITGASVFTHKLPRASDYAKPFIFAAHPELEGVDASVVTPANYREWLAGQQARLGDSFALTSIGTDQFDDPIGDAVEMVGADRVITIDASAKEKR